MAAEPLRKKVAEPEHFDRGFDELAARNEALLSCAGETRHEKDAVIASVLFEPVKARPAMTP
jgi:hypothetical protein